MDLSFKPEYEDFRKEVIEFLDSELTSELREAGKLTASVFSEVEYSSKWHKILHKKGWIGGKWPKEYGGTGWDDMQRYIFSTECAKAGAPSPTAMGLAMVGPVLMKYGTQKQKDLYLPKILSGEDFWCQGYSEPGSGSDLASLQCKAVKNGDHYIVNGTKIWTTHAQHANRIFCLVRTDNSGKPQQGITFLLIDMDTPGIEIKPIITMAGDHEVNQTFFDDVKVPVENVLKGVGKGFPIAMNALDNSRIGIAAQALGIAQGSYEAALKYSHEREAFGKPIAYHQMIMSYLSDMATRIDAARLLVYKASWAKQQHYEHDGPRHTKEASMAKLYAGDTAMWVSERAIQVLGGYGYTKEFPVERFFRDAKITQIYEGTQEVQRIVIARSLV